MCHVAVIHRVVAFLFHSLRGFDTSHLTGLGGTSLELVINDLPADGVWNQVIS
jgi:hypothetical protein